MIINIFTSALSYKTYMYYNYNQLLIITQATMFQSDAQTNSKPRVDPWFTHPALRMISGYVYIWSIHNLNDTVYS